MWLMSATVEKKSEAGESQRVELPVTGMTCVACARRIERRLSKTEGVSAASVNFATGRATVEYDAARTGVRRRCAGVSRRSATASGRMSTRRPPGRRRPRRAERARRAARDLRRRFVAGRAARLPVCSSSRCRTAPSPLFDVPWINWLQLALAAPVVFYCGAPFFRGAWAALRHRAADMNTLIATGTGAAFLYSVVATVAPAPRRAGGVTPMQPA